MTIRFYWVKGNGQVKEVDWKEQWEVCRRYPKAYIKFAVVGGTQVMLIGRRYNKEQDTIESFPIWMDKSILSGLMRSQSPRIRQANIN